VKIRSTMEGSTENATVATALLADLVERAWTDRDAVRPRRLQGPAQGGAVVFARCRCSAAVAQGTQRAWASPGAGPPQSRPDARAWRRPTTRALEQLRQLAGELDTPILVACLAARGHEETLTVIKLGIKGKLRRTLESTNACESMIDTVRRTQRNVKNWAPRDGAALDASGCAKPSSSSARSSATPTCPPRVRSNTNSTSPAKPAVDQEAPSQSLCKITRTVVTNFTTNGQPHRPPRGRTAALPHARLAALTAPETSLPRLGGVPADRRSAAENCCASSCSVAAQAARSARLLATVTESSWIWRSIRNNTSTTTSRPRHKSPQPQRAPHP